MLDKLYQKALEWFLGSGKFASIIRHGMSTVGGFLISSGLSEQVVEPTIEPNTQLLVGVINIIISYLLSRINKKKTIPTPRITSVELN